jgi:hypothetical protein
MSLPIKWKRCIYHAGQHVEPFFEDYLDSNQRQILVIGGAGFDPRSTHISRIIAKYATNPPHGFFIREQRPRPAAQLSQNAAANESVLRQIFSTIAIEHLEVFANDEAVVGGRTAAKLVSDLNLENYTDIFVDLSALSIGIAFPIVRFLYENLSQTNVNLHLVVVDEPATDSAIRSTPHHSASTVHGFKGTWDLDQVADAAKLWMPQLSFNKRTILELIHTRVRPHSVCPILPFPASVPRLPDKLIETYEEEFNIPWEVDARDIIYAHERSPVDLYRTILRIDDARRSVFAETGGSQIILSPLGSKALAIGALMAALERNFTVMYVESIAYSVNFNGIATMDPEVRGEIVHIWLHGEAYGTVDKVI